MPPFCFLFGHIVRVLVTEAEMQVVEFWQLPDLGQLQILGQYSISVWACFFSSAELRLTVQECPELSGLPPASL